MSFGAGAVQATGGSTGSGTAVSKAFASNVAVGNLITVSGMKFSPGADDPFVAGDCTQTAGAATLGPISLDQTVSRSLGTDRLVTGQWSCVVTGAGALTLQVGGALAASAINIGIAEFHSDVATAFSVEATNTGTGASGNPVTGSSASAGAAVFVGAVTISSGVITVTEGAGYSLIFEQQDGSAFVVCSSESQIVSGATTDTADWTAGTNTGWQASLVIYKEVVTGTGTVIGPTRTTSKFRGAPAQRFAFRHPITPIPVTEIPTAAISSAGAATATFTTQSSAAVPFSSAGVSTATFNAQSSAAVAFSSAGAATATFTTQSGAQSSLSAAGVATATFTTQSSVATPFSTSGVATAIFTTQARASADFTMSGTATAVFTATTGGTSSAEAVMAGSATANFAAASLAPSAFTVSGQATVLFRGQAVTPNQRPYLQWGKRPPAQETYDEEILALSHAMGSYLLDMVEGRYVSKAKIKLGRKAH